MRRILVVDDSPTIHKVIKIAFSRHDFVVVSASSMIEAIAEIARDKPDLLILDASLSDAKGVEEYRRLQESSGAPVLLLSGSYEAIDEEAFRDAGLGHFLKKPFESQDMVAAATKLLGTLPKRAEAQSQDHDEDLDDGSSAYRGKMPDLEATVPPPFIPPPPPPRFDEARKGQKAFVPPPATPMRFPTGMNDLVAHVNTNQDTGIAAFEQNLADDLINKLPPLPPGFPPPKASPAPVWKGSLPPEEAELRRRLEEFLRQEAEGLIKSAVESYCSTHFKSLAREILTIELRRLAEERSRLLVEQ